MYLNRYLKLRLDKTQFITNYNGYNITNSIFDQIRTFLELLMISKYCFHSKSLQIKNFNKTILEHLTIAQNNF